MNEEFEKQFLELQKKVGKIEKGTKDQLTMVVFSGDLDKQIAAMIISTGAAAFDMKVKLFFTFWATAALRDPKKKVGGKNFLGKMFGMMLPKGAGKLKLSKMHMMGMGASMIKGLMKKKKVASLPEMFKTAGELGVEINVCEMSMDLMGFKPEELIDYPHMKICGVATFLADAAESKVQMFI
ncbi:MAG TPA: NADH dehydrogenase FAD-containing subunit [Bacteroidales bacterium]|nr:NADH dehydrogenase FAD-containing subunit [Bacteroidales bacterium]HCB62393.1 NADH dehydrogenase FAD-containing subunit [Bacteroidales bacterium]HCY21848.1 NADH dehydrogenase FAD-containing subunit [Bacteroidales bacterium]